jgi:hypothetical protein
MYDDQISKLMNSTAIPPEVKVELLKAVAAMDQAKAIERLTTMLGVQLQRFNENYARFVLHQGKI